MPLPILAILLTGWGGGSVQVWSVHMHSNVKSFKIITLHSNIPTYLQHFKEKRKINNNNNINKVEEEDEEKERIGWFVLNMKILWCLSILKKFMQ